MGIHQYENGNVTVTINLENGTKERFTLDNEFHPLFPESIDINITSKCDGNCKFCYANSTLDGVHADLLSKYITEKFIPSLHPYTELALNGNDLSHPHLPKFLELLKEHNVIANITVNQTHFMRNLSLLHNWQEKKLIHGLGVSLNNSGDEKFLNEISNFPNSVIHAIAGILSDNDIENLKNKKIKLLILGYKNKGRGGKFYERNKESVNEKIYSLRDNLPRIMKENFFELVSFDNLSVEQLDIKSLVPKEEWERYYMGDDGSFTFFIDLVEMKYARNSMTTDMKYIDGKDVNQMFKSF